MILHPVEHAGPWHRDIQSWPYPVERSEAIDGLQDGSDHSLGALAATSDEDIQSHLPGKTLCLFFVLCYILCLQGLDVGLGGVVAFHLQNASSL